jgi:glutamate racemase
VGTVRSGAYVRAVRDLDPLCDVIQQACPKLVPIVESGKAGTPEALETVREYVGPLLSEGGVVNPVVDTLLLGCTHYPLLGGLIADLAGEGVAIVDSATATASALSELLGVNGLDARRDGGDGTAAPAHVQLTTGDPARFAELAGRLFGPEFVSVEAVKLGALAR